MSLEPPFLPPAPQLVQPLICLWQAARGVVNVHGNPSGIIVKPIGEFQRYDERGGKAEFDGA